MGDRNRSPGSRESCRVPGSVRSATGVDDYSRWTTSPYRPDRETVTSTAVETVSPGNVRRAVKSPSHENYPHTTY